MKLRNCLLSLFLLSSAVDVQAMDVASSSCLHRAYHYLAAEQYDSAYVYASSLYDSAVATQDRHLLAQGQVCLWYASAMMGNECEAQSHFDEARQIASADGDAFLSLFDSSSNVDQQAVDDAVREVRHQKNLVLASVSAFSIFIIIGVLFLYFYQRRQLRALKASLTVIPQLPADVESGVRPGSTLLSDPKRQELVTRLEQLMSEQHIYREKLLTRDKVAALLETNRTYIGQIMMEYYHKSFTQYINDLRIDEAVQILNNPLCTRPIKLIGQDLGFNSVTTFNSQFQARTGLTPAQYRQNTILQQQESEVDS